MPLNVSDGALEWDAAINLEDFDKAAAAMQSSLKSVTTAAVEEARKQQAAISQMLQGLNTDHISKPIKENQEVLFEIVDTYKELGDTVSKFYDVSKESFEKLSDIQRAQQEEFLLSRQAMGQELSEEQKEWLRMSEERAQAFRKEVEERARLKRESESSSSGSAKQNTFSIPGIDDKVFEQSKAVLAATDEETQAYIKNLVDLKVKLSQVNQAQKTLNDEHAAGNVSIKDYKEAAAALAAQEKQIEDTIAKITQKQKEYDQLNNASIGSLEQKKIALKQLETQLAQLSEVERADAAIVNQYKSEIAALKEEINQIKAETVVNAGDKIKSLYGELRQLKAKLIATPVDDPGYQALFEKASQLSDKIKDVNAGIKLAGSDTAAIDALTQGVRGLVGGFTALQGAIGLFTDDNSEMEKTIKNVTSAMAILQGVQEVTNVLEKNSALNKYLLLQYTKLTTTATAEQAVATEAVAVAQETEAAATVAASEAQVGLNAAMAANPAGILLLAITGVVVAINAFSSASVDAQEKQKNINEALAEANQLLVQLADAYTQVYRDRTKDAENAVDLAQAQGRSENDILRLRQKALDAKRLENVAILSNLELDAKSLKYNEDLLTVRKEQLEAIQRQTDASGKLSEANQKEADVLKSEINRLQSLTDKGRAAMDTIKETDAASAALQAEIAKKAHDDALKSDQALAEARLILARKNSAEELKAQIANIKQRAQVDLDNVNQTAGERKRILAQEQKDIEDANRKYKILQLNNEKSLLQVRLDNVKEGSAEELKLKIDKINKDAEIELQQEGVTEQKKAQIKADARKAINDQIKKYDQEQIAAEISTTIAGLNTRLALVQEGSVEELNIKKDLVEQKALQDINSANQQIKNEKQLAARIQEINSKATLDKKKLDDDYTEHHLQNIFKVIDRQTQYKNLPLESILNDPTSTVEEKDKAQLGILDNQKVDTLTKIQQINEAIKSNAGNVNKLLEQREDLYLQLLKIIDQINNQGKKTEQDRLNTIISKANDVSSAFKNLASSAQGFNSELSDSIQMLATMADSVAKSVQGLKDFKASQGKGDVIGQFTAGADIASAIASAVQNVFKNIEAAQQSKKDAQQAIKDFNTQMLIGEIQITEEYRNRQREQVKLNKLKSQGLEDERRLLNQQKQDLTKQYNDILSQIQKETYVVGLSETSKRNISQALQGVIGLFGSKKTSVTEITASLAGKSFEELEALFTKGQLTGKAKELFQELQKIKQEGVDIDNLLEQNRQEMAQIFTGTTADDISQAIIDGFKQGKRSAQDFADTFQELMQNAALSAFEAKVIEAKIQDFYDEFAKAAESDGGLTQNKIDGLKNTFSAMIGDISNQFDQLQQITGLDFSGSSSSNANSLKGSIKAMTEQTAEVLAGQLGGMRIGILENNRLLTQHGSYLNNIEANTALTVARLDDMMRKMNQWFTIDGIKLK